MAKGLVSDTNLTAIANAIRTKNGSSDRYTPATMAPAISDIPTSQVDQTTALQYMLNNKTDYTGIAAGLTTLTELPEFTQPSGITRFARMFYNCKSMVDVADVDFSTANDCEGLFYGCTKLASIPTLPFRQISNVSSMFQGCTSLTGEITISSGGPSSLKSREAMFSGCSGITKITFSGTFYGVQNMDNTFRGCTRLQRIQKGTTQSLKAPYMTRSGTFANCSAITSGSFYGIVDTTTEVGGKIVTYSECYSGCSSMQNVAMRVSANLSFNHTFSGCSALTNVSFSGQPLLCQDFTYMFQNCTSLVTAPTMDTPAAKAFGYMFDGCTNLVNVSTLDMSSVDTTTYHQNMFRNCPSLSNTSLNNILSSLSTSPVSENRTLKYVGLSSAQATTCTGLSNWAALSAAGWTTGY